VGEYTDAGGTFHGFLWDKGRFTTIDVPDGATTFATDINDCGEIVASTARSPECRPCRLPAERGGLHHVRCPRCPDHHPLCHQQRGKIVGTTIASPGTLGRGFVLREGAEGPFTPIDVTGAQPEPAPLASTTAAKSSASP
jgi:hypothetical protein